MCLHLRTRHNHLQFNHDVFLRWSDCIAISWSETFCFISVHSRKSNRYFGQITIFNYFFSPLIFENWLKMDQMYEKVRKNRRRDSRAVCDWMGTQTPAYHHISLSRSSLIAHHPKHLLIYCILFLFCVCRVVSSRPIPKVSLRLIVISRLDTNGLLKQ